MRSFVPEYELVSATGLGDALALLTDDWRPIAGGTDLMVLFNAGKLPFRKLVSVRGLEELLAIDITKMEVSVGAAVTYSRIRQHPVLQDEFPLLCSAASWTGSIANQNRGTLGGNIVNASPAADSAPALLVYDAELELASTAGTRRVRYRDFHLGYKQLQMRDGELLRAIILPRKTSGWRQYSRKVGPRKAQAISKVCFVAAAQLSGSVIEDVRIAAGSVAPVPLRCYAAEAVLRGQTLSSNLFETAAKTISSEVQPITDLRSSESYRRAVTANLLTEFLHSLR
jgi:CO/xanthine dehydrogenase FAD-binding subunit